jgi:hypothetical protein
MAEIARSMAGPVVDGRTAAWERKGMSEHRAEVVWERGAQTFIDNRYSRAHRWRFDGGAEVHASASPANVRPPFADPSAVDP